MRLRENLSRRKGLNDHVYLLVAFSSVSGGRISAEAATKIKVKKRKSYRNPFININ